MSENAENGCDKQGGLGEVVIDGLPRFVGDIAEQINILQRGRVGLESIPFFLGIYVSEIISNKHLCLHKKSREPVP